MVTVDVPRLLVLTDRRASAVAGRTLAETVREAVDAGAPAVVLREKDLPPLQRRRLAEEIAVIVAGSGARLLVAGTSLPPNEVGASGVHLSASDRRLPSVDVGLVGRSCHDHAEVAAARREEVDYLTVSPVATTASKPGHGPALGREGVTALVEAARPVPVLALGGVTPQFVVPLLEAGVHGFAVMGGVMRAADPASAVSELLDATLEASS